MNNYFRPFVWLFAWLATTSWLSAQVSLSWLRTWHAGGEESAHHLKLDSNENAIVAGGAYPRVAIVQYDREGNLQWERFHSGQIGDGNRWDAMELDSTDSAALVGFSLDERYEPNAFIVKYANDGALLWTRYFNYPGSRFTTARDLAIDSQDNIWVVGQAFFEALDFAQLAILKYSPTGQLLWRRLYDGPSREARGTPSIALDRDDHAYIATSTPGRAVPGITSNSDFLLIKYSPSGERLWERRFDGPVEGSDFPRCIAYDPRGYILMGGNVDINPAPEEQSYALALLRYTLEGNMAGVWMNLPDDDLYHRHFDYFNALVVGADGSIGGAATYFPPSRDGFVPNGKDVTAARFDPDFNFQWLRAYNTVNDEAGAFDVEMDIDGNVYTSGAAYLQPDNPNVQRWEDAIVLKYSPEGRPLWFFRWQGSAGDALESSNSIALDSRNNLVAGGWTQPFPNALPDFLTFKLCQIQGDADRNGTVDGADIELVIERFGLPGDPETASGDLNGDGIVDDTDLALVLTDFGKVCRN